MSGGAVLLSRRAVLAGSGALVFSFSSLGRLPAQESGGAQAGAASPQLPGSLKKTPFLDSWIRIDADGKITIFTGKAELGQGIKTALLQIAAEELDVGFKRLTLVTADTGRTPDEEYTAGSHSVQDSGTAIMNAAAQVRQLLIEQAATHSGVPANQLQTENAVVVAPDGRRFAYGDLVTDQLLHVQAAPQSPLKEPQQFKVMDRSVPRVDIPAKMTGGEAYVQDLRPTGMVHGRVVRPPSYAAKLLGVDTGPIENMPGVIKVVRDGNFLGVIAAGEFQAIEAMRALAAAARWEETAQLPNSGALPDFLMAQPSRDITVLDARQPSSATKTLSATYTRPYIAHGSIGPSCALALHDGDALTIWTHSQGVYPLRDAIAEMLGMAKEQVRCIHAEGAGCYGQNGADDVAADAALLARAMPGRPVRLQWMREQEHAHEPYGPAMVVKVNAGLDDGGRIIDWDYALWSNTHATRPGPAGSLIAARSLAKAFPQPAPKPIPMPEGGGDRNSIPLYKFPSARVIYHFLPNMPVRVSALRALGAHLNIFAIESFMDELSDAAGADPVQFRLQHLDDPRARDVITTAAQRFGWSDRSRSGTRACGFAFARYKNLAAYCAIACEVEVERNSGRARMLRAVAAVDAGQVVNPDGVVNQIEGAILQSMSWTLFENVAFDERRITSIDWATYPILRFSGVPDALEVHIVQRSGQPFLGCGEAGQGPAAAAIGNAIAAATGQRLRDLPLSRERIKAAIGF
jgi:CO/xanthine dehydrogenase Mo-binding subunit